MELKILEEKNNALFNRKEIKFSLDSDISPSREDTLKLIASKFKVSEENIKIKGIHGRFGSNTFSVEANIYSSKEEKDKIEIKKKKEQEAEKKLEEASAAKEQPVEEKIEEKTEASEKPDEQKEVSKEENTEEKNVVNTDSTSDDKPIEDKQANEQQGSDLKPNEIPSDSEANK